MKTRLLRFLPLLFLSLPAHGFACAVCMGAPGSKVVDAGNGFVFSMLGFLGLMFAGIGGFAFYLKQRARTPLAAHEALAHLVGEEGRQHA